MSHTITVTQVADDEHDEAEYIVGGTCTSRCVVWYECNRKACQAMNPYYEPYEERTRHGVFHQHIPSVGWCTESTDCGLIYATELDIEASYTKEPGTYPLEVTWDGDYWMTLIDWDNPVHNSTDPEPSGAVRVQGGQDR